MKVNALLNEKCQLFYITMRELFRTPFFNDTFSFISYFPLKLIITQHVDEKADF